MFCKIKLLYLNINENANFVGLKSLKSRRLVFDITFIRKIANGDIE